MKILLNANHFYFLIKNNNNEVITNRHVITKNQCDDKTVTRQTTMK